MSVVIKKDGRVTWRGNCVGTVVRVARPAGGPLWRFEGFDESAPHDVTTSLRRLIYHHVQRHYVAREKQQAQGAW